MKHIVVFSVFVLILTLSSLGINFSVVQAFHVPSSSSSSSSSSSNNNWTIRNRQQSSTSTSLSSSPLLSLRQRKRQQQQRVVQLFASSSKDDDSGGGGAGMEDAFRELEALQSLDEPERPKEKPKEKDEAFAKAMGNLDLKDILSKVDDDNDDDYSKTKTPSLESELEIFKDMASELELASEKEELIVADFKSDLLLADDDDIDIDNDGVPAFDTEKFMDQAIEEALKEAKERNSDVEQIMGDKEAFLDNKEIMSEITKIFDVANDELLEGLEEIRIEQVRCL